MNKMTKLKRLRKRKKKYEPDSSLNDKNNSALCTKIDNLIDIK